MLDLVKCWQKAPALSWQPSKVNGVQLWSLLQERGSLTERKALLTFFFYFVSIFVQCTITIKSFTGGYLLSSISLGCCFFSLAFVLSWACLITNLRNELLNSNLDCWFVIYRSIYLQKMLSSISQTISRFHFNAGKGVDSSHLCFTSNL